MPEIKETLELLEGLKVIGETGAKIFADGKVNLADLPKLGELGKNFGVLKDAVVGVKDIKQEVTDLDQNEIMQIVGKVLEIVNAVKDSLKEE